MCTTVNLTDDQEETLNSLNYWFNGITCITVAMIGLLFNSVTIYILMCKKGMQNMFNYILVAILGADNFFLLTNSLNILHFCFEIKELIWIVPQFVYPWGKTSLAATIFLTLCLAHQRYLITCDVADYRRISASPKSRRHRIMLYIIPAVGFAILINLPRYFCKERVLGKDGQTWKLEDTELQKNHHFQTLYDKLFGLVITGIAPLTVLILFNWRVYQQILERKKDLKNTATEIMLSTRSGTKSSHGETLNKLHPNMKRRSGRNHNLILITIVIVFIICHSLRCIHDFYVGLYEPFGVKVMQILSQFLLILNSSLNPLIYISRSRKFRKHLLVLMRINRTDQEVTFLV